MLYFPIKISFKPAFLVQGSSHKINIPTLDPPPHPSNKGCKAVAHEAVFVYREWVKTKPMY